MADNPLLPPEQGIRMLQAQLNEAVEHLRHSDPDAYSWEEITLKIVERAFGEHSRNAGHFGSSVSYTPETEEEAQEQYVRRIRSLKAMLRQFIKELEIIPNHRPAAHPEYDNEKPDTSPSTNGGAVGALPIHGNKSLIKKIWTDPVGSKVIAGVLWAAGLYWLKLVPQLGVFLAVQVKVPVWAIVASLLFTGLLSFGIGKKRTPSKR